MEWVAVALGVLAMLAIIWIVQRWHAGRERREDERLRQKVARILDDRQRLG
jgi:hypothetical protein